MRSPKADALDGVREMARQARREKLMRLVAPKVEPKAEQPNDGLSDEDAELLAEGFGQEGA